jgi:tight adherence protein C
VSALPIVLGAAWGLVLAAPLVRRGFRASTSERVRSLPSRDDVGRPARVAIRTRRDVLARRVASAPGLAPIARAVRHLVGVRAARREGLVVQRDLPVTIDVLAVAIGAGCTPFVAVDVTSQWAPADLARLLDGVRRDCALGAGFADALDAMAVRVPPLRPLVEALLASERYGAPVGAALGRLAVEQRAAVRRRAEARARTVPVRLLFPLVFLVLPAFGLLTVVPALLTGFAG